MYFDFIYVIFKQKGRFPFAIEPKKHNFAPMTTAYLGSVDYYRQLLRGGEVVDNSVSYVKQTTMNRCYIDSPNGALALSVPVTNPHGRVPVSEILVSEHGNWRHQHWNALVSSYRQTPYFDYYEEEFFPFYHEHRWVKLADLNEGLHQAVMKLLDPFPLLPDDRSLAGPYHQMFAHKHGFLENLSIVDLLFNMGPESVYYL